MKILIYIQSNSEKINPISLESIVAAQELKESKNAEIYAVTFSREIESQLSKYNLDQIIYLENKNLLSYNPLYYIEAFKELIAIYNPKLIHLDN